MSTLIWFDASQELRESTRSNLPGAGVMMATILTCDDIFLIWLGMGLVAVVLEYRFT